MDAKFIELGRMETLNTALWGMGIVAILINMNDYLVTNQLADIISKNVIFAIWGKEQYKVSGNPYIVRHLLLNGAYFALLKTAVGFANNRYQVI